MESVFNINPSDLPKLQEYHLFEYTFLNNIIDVEYNKSEIINKINSYFGYKVIDKIRLEKFNTKIVSKKNIYISDASKSRYLKSINNIKNEKLKKSLIKLTESFK